ncbi:ubiquitin carboxyl-hydrolase [Providencia vermicola]|uniref:terminase small subunit-like protein n=1 Tax=Providencia vermicola TaxID=333965 RepID=UPI0034D6C061
MATKTKMGRPSDYLPEVADDICALIADGESLRSVCKRKGMPNTTKVMRWLRENPDFREQYAKAMESRADAVFEELFDIADDVSEESAAVAKAKLRIDTRKWALSRMSPKKYGDKISQDIDVKSSDGSMTPQPTKIVLVAGGNNDGSED